MHTNLALMGMGGGEIVFVMVVALVLFGSSKIPQFAKGLGQAIKEFKKASSDVSNEINNAMNQEPAPPRPPAPPAKPQTEPETAASAPAATVPKS